MSCSAPNAFFFAFPDFFFPDLSSSSSCCFRARSFSKLRKILENNEDWKNFLIRNHGERVRAVVTATYVPHQALITSSPRMPSCEVEMLRNTREDLSIPGNVFDCQHTRRDPDDLCNDSRIWRHHEILRTEGIEKTRRRARTTELGVEKHQLDTKQTRNRRGNFH